MMGLFGPEMLYRIPALLIAVTFHEYAHGRMALFWGDPTAKRQGRLTLNPISHLDPIGALMVILVGFGWARPVPVNPFNFYDQRKGMFWVSFAGIGANLIIAFIGTLIYFVYLFSSPDPLLIGGDGFIINIIYSIIVINVYLAIFNLVPLPPLDGSKIISSVLPPRYLEHYHAIEPYAPMILILLLITVLPAILRPIAFLIISVFEVLARFMVGLIF